MFQYKHYALVFAVIATYSFAPAIAENYKTVWDSAYNLVRKNDNSSAIDILNKGIKENPKNGDLYYLRGALFADKEKYQDAISDQSKSIELGKKKNLVAAAYLNKARCEFTLKQNDDANKDYRKLLDIEPDLAIAHFEYATFLFRTSKGDEAVQHIEKSKKLEKIGSIKKRDTEINKLLKIADTGKYAKRATDALQVNEIDKAISILNDGIKMTPNNDELKKLLEMANR
jgi:tetratricopeptide (TPR) repeat protein